MEVAASSSIIVTSYSPPKTNGVFFQNHSNFPASVRLIRDGRLTKRRISAVNEVSSGVTWQIVVGTLAGVTPFVVAGIEFNKRIVAQRRCEECGGSGLVLRKKQYFRCPQCVTHSIRIGPDPIDQINIRILIFFTPIISLLDGGFLPWQSWKRFFSG